MKIDQKIEAASLANADKFYHAQGDITQVMPWSDCKESFFLGARMVQSELMPVIEMLKGALEFYGDRVKHQDHSINISIPNNRVKTSSIEDDQGRKARKALSDLKELGIE